MHSVGKARKKVRDWLRRLIMKPVFRDTPAIGGVKPVWDGSKPIKAPSEGASMWRLFRKRRHEPQKRIYHGYPVRGNSAEGYHVSLDMSGNELIIPISKAQLEGMHTPRNGRPAVTVKIDRNTGQVRVTDYNTDAPVAEFHNFTEFLKKK